MYMCVWVCVDMLNVVHGVIAYKYVQYLSVCMCCAPDSISVIIQVYCVRVCVCVWKKNTNVCAQACTFMHMYMSTPSLVPRPTSQLSTNTHVAVMSSIRSYDVGLGMRLVHTNCWYPISPGYGWTLGLDRSSSWVVHGQQGMEIRYRSNFIREAV
jgi:hypothetical protein